MSTGLLVTFSSFVTSANMEVSLIKVGDNGEGVVLNWIVTLFSMVPGRMVNVAVEDAFPMGLLRLGTTLK